MSSGYLRFCALLDSIRHRRPHDASAAEGRRWSGDLLALCGRCERVRTSGRIGHEFVCDGCARPHVPAVLVDDPAVPPHGNDTSSLFGPDEQSRPVSADDVPTVCIRR